MQLAIKGKGGLPSVHSDPKQNAFQENCGITILRLNQLINDPFECDKSEATAIIDHLSLPWIPDAIRWPGCLEARTVRLSVRVAILYFVLLAYSTGLF